MSNFTKGLIGGVAVSVVFFCLICALWFFHNRDKELIEYAEKEKAVEALREDYGNRDPYEFLDTVPGVRGAADGAAADFERKRDEAVQRFRNRLTD